MYCVWQNSVNFLITRLSSYMHTFMHLVFLCRLIETLNSWFVSGTHLPLCLTAPRKFLNNEVEGSHVQTYLHLPNLGWFQTLEILNLSLSFSLYSRPEVWPRSDFGLKQFCDTGRSRDHLIINSHWVGLGHLSEHSGVVCSVRTCCSYFLCMFWALRIQIYGTMLVPLL